MNRLSLRERASGFVCFCTSLTTVHDVVVNATNGKEALDLLSSREDIDMVLTDVLMPEVWFFLQVLSQLADL